MYTWKIYGITVVALFLKMLAIILIQVNTRRKSNNFSTPEDAATFGKGGTGVVQESQLLQRATKTLNNDGENIPIFLFLATAYVNLGCWEQGTLIYFPLFVLSRFAHSIAFLRAMQPLRTRAYQLGLSVMVVLSGHILWTALSK
ncbi:MAPEG family protein [Nostoc sp. FACHB-973]|uniref:Microsomal glutathione S-transferase 1 n=1 Tax=Desmonostoc muscorum LEGE 12446 TaxID=1828758 RepID=A0A8J7DAT6_DESMC|nr:MAPEG family protein [Desmonostoc muscorum]MBD2516449.1 MAPEG family protein [Nostoc sp. FACHB-973]MCF2149833.1 MAPEG family protein [Desmonostoc muscorum LEGE 12446]